MRRLLIPAVVTLGFCLAAGETSAQTVVNGLNWSQPIVVSGPNAFAQAQQIAWQMGGRLPTPQEFQAASPMLRQYAQFNRPFHVFFTGVPGTQWSVAMNASHMDGGKYYGFDLVTVVTPIYPINPDPFPSGGLLGGFLP